MQFISLCLFTILLGYSLVIAAPIQQTTPMTEEAKHQKAHAIANRLLQELAGEQQQVEKTVSQPQQEAQTNEEIKSEKKPAVEKVESRIQNNNEELYDDEDIDSAPSLEDLVELYGDKYADLIDDEEPSSEIFEDDEYILPDNAEELLRYLAEQEESDEYAPVIHTPVMDDSIMTAEDHQRRRRSIY